MSHWEQNLKVAGLPDVAAAFHSVKTEDMQRLQHSGLPQFPSITLPYAEFHKQNLVLMKFISQNQGVCVRALPKPEGLQQGFTRGYQYGKIGFEECERFLKEKIQEPFDLWDVGLTEWEPNANGFVIISGSKSIRGEIGINLETLSHGQEIPLAIFEIDRRMTGHLANKTSWPLVRDPAAAAVLWRAYRCITFPGGNFQPYCRRGYFEGITTQKGAIKFMDFKTNEAYLD